MILLRNMTHDLRDMKEMYYDITGNFVRRNEMAIFSEENARHQTHAFSSNTNTHSYRHGSGRLHRAF